MRTILTLAMMAVTMIMVQAQDFVKGADIGWITQIERRGEYQIVDMDGNPVDAHDLMKQLDMSAERIRVWVNPQKDPTDGVAYCGLDDVVEKAVRAKDRGLEVMIDFHYSNWWADPGKQIIPQEWKNCNIEQLCDSMAAHTIETLSALKANGVYPRWIQVGNEIAPGFMHPMGNAYEHPAEFAKLFKAGYEACKSVFPEVQVILHIDNGYDLERTTRIIDILKENDADFDVMGWSLYPAMNWVTNEVDENWQRKVDQCIANSFTIFDKYGKESMLVEVGMPDKDEMVGRDCIAYIIKNHGPHIQGLFWWEPFTTPDFHYSMGALKSYGDNKYGPNEALKVFRMGADECVSPTQAVIDNIMSRRSIRKYKDQPIPHEILDEILECGINAPNGMNQQNYEVKVVDDAASVEYLAENIRGLYKAPVYIFIAAGNQYDMSRIDVGLLSENIGLAAWAYGIGSINLGMPVRALKDNPEILKKLGFGEQYELCLVLALGYPDETPAAKPRKKEKIEFVKIPQ